MRTRKWGPEGPPEDAYSSVANPERFRPLHELALNLIARLEAEFDVDRMECYGLDKQMEESPELARPSIKLTPSGDSAHRSPWHLPRFRGSRFESAAGLLNGFPTVAAMPVMRRLRKGIQNSRRWWRLLSQAGSGRGTLFLAMTRGWRWSTGLTRGGDPGRVASTEPSPLGERWMRPSSGCSGRGGHEYPTGSHLMCAVEPSVAQLGRILQPWPTLRSDFGNHTFGVGNEKPEVCLRYTWIVVLPKPEEGCVHTGAAFGQDGRGGGGNSVISKSFIHRHIPMFAWAVRRSCCRIAHIYSRWTTLIAS